MVGLGIRPERHSYGIIKKSGEFVVNMPQASQVELVDHCGVVSGREHDKFAECGFTPLSGTMIKAPLIDECPVNLECQVRKILPLGTHDLFIGEVVLVHYDEELMVNGRFDLSAADPLAYGFSHYFRLGELIGRHGESVLRKR
jgi:flavin reductase (DIM6/NTAB) family NADH-FMN oxidoreductase RutF